jgi:hypothetical protein
LLLKYILFRTELTKVTNTFFILVFIGISPIPRLAVLILAFLLMGR